MTGNSAVPADAPLPPGVQEESAPYDAGVPHPARVYAYWLGTKDHCQVDRDAAEEVMRHRPQVRATAQANRAFGRRVTSYAAQGCGIRQFLDIGTGLPAPDATHEVAQHAAAGCRVVYADNDPVVLAHARAWLTPAAAASGTCGYIAADVRDPATLLEKAASILDFSQPAAVWLLAVLHFVADGDDPAGIVGELAAALAPRSLIAISHLTADSAPDAVVAAAAAFNARASVPVCPRSHGEVTALFGELPLVWPGVVPITQWWPPFREAPGGTCDMYGGVAAVRPRKAQPDGTGLAGRADS
ncbi:MAG: SAM-dependent methyltransferase [Streptosporangiaceae bacterium]